MRQQSAEKAARIQVIAYGNPLRCDDGDAWQVAEAIRRESGIATAAVGMITDPVQADEILRAGQADAVMVAREFLRDPYLGFTAARELGESIDVPRQYGRAIDLG